MKIEQLSTQTIQAIQTHGMSDASAPQNAKAERAALAEKTSFKTALNLAAADSAGLNNKISGAFSDYIKTWNSTESSLGKRLNKLSPDNKNLIEMQIDINNFNLKTLFLTQCAEACNSTIKRVQQMGNS